MAEEKKKSGGSRALTMEEQARLQEWVKNKARGGPTCPVCGHTSWHAHSEFVELRPFAGGNLMFGGIIIPAVLLVCTTCSNMLLINALGTGIMLPEPKEATKPEAKEANG